MASNALEHFLNFPLYRTGEHPHKPDWDKFVYDIEDLHYGFLSMFFKHSAGFATEFFRLPAEASADSVMPPYNDHPFDLEVRVAAQTYYVEVKTWAELKPSQVERQFEHLQDRKANGVYLLTPFQPWSADQITKATGSLAHRVSFDQVAESLQSNLRDLKGPVKQVAEVYIPAIRDLMRRTQEAA